MRPVNHTGKGEAGCKEAPGFGLACSLTAKATSAYARTNEILFYRPFYT